MCPSESESLEDRRIRRTRQSLRIAFMELLHERDWDQIRVQDICDRANVGRSTFYNHFVDKEGLLVGGLSDLGNQLKASFGGKPDAPILWFARGLIDHILASEEVFRNILKSRSSSVIQSRFCQLAIELARDCLVSRGVPEPRLSAAANFLGGAFMQLLVWYVNARRRPNTDGLEAMFHEMAQSALTVP